MMGHTHGMIGAAAGLAVAFATHQPPAVAVALAAGAAAAALFPDIDHPNGAIRQRMGAASILLFWLSHRGITHTFLALAGVALASFTFAPYAAALAITAGYGSHLLSDMLTRQGLPVFWPVSQRSIHLLPWILRISTGSWAESVVFLLALGAAIMLGVNIADMG